MVYWPAPGIYLQDMAPLLLAGPPPLSIHIHIPIHHNPSIQSGSVPAKHVFARVFTHVKILIPADNGGGGGIFVGNIGLNAVILTLIFPGFFVGSISPTASMLYCNV